MVHVHGPRDENLDSESQRPLEMSLALPHQVRTLLRVQRLPLGVLAEESLVEIAPFTLEMVKVRAAEVGSVSVEGVLTVRTSQGRIPSVRKVKAAAKVGDRSLEHRKSEVNQA